MADQVLQSFAEMTADKVSAHNSTDRGAAMLEPVLHSLAEKMASNDFEHNATEAAMLDQALRTLAEIMAEEGSKHDATDLQSLAEKRAVEASEHIATAGEASTADQDRQSLAERRTEEHSEHNATAGEAETADQADGFNTNELQLPDAFPPSALLERDSAFESLDGIRRHRRLDGSYDDPNDSGDFNGAQQVVQTQLTRGVQQIADKANAAASLVKTFSENLNEYHRETGEMALLMKSVEPFEKYIQNTIGNLADWEKGRVDSLRHIDVTGGSAGRTSAESQMSSDILERVEQA